MSADPRKYYRVKNCGGPVNTIASNNRTIARNNVIQSSRKSMLDNITKLGDLEILNDVGYGKVGQGLRALAAISDSVRVGQSVVPGRENTDTYNSLLGSVANIAIDSVDQGAQVVLDALGLGGAVERLTGFNPNVVNNAVGDAKQIFRRIKQGNFSISDIPTVFANLQNLEQLARGVFGGNPSPFGGPQSATGVSPYLSQQNYLSRPAFCGASPYAVDLLAQAPKFNFLFVVEVTFNPGYEAWSDIAQSTAFVVKTSTRPSVEFEYQEVNMYNYRTQVPKRTQYQPMSMSFYDDNKNAVHLFYTAYMRAMSPIANIGVPEGGNAPLSSTAPENYQQASMEFGRGPTSATFGQNPPRTNGYSASLGVLNDNNINLLSRIRLYHVFDYGTSMNIYNFYNPKITKFSPSELSMEGGGDATTFEFEFAYDGLFIEPGFSVLEPLGKSKLSALTQGKQYRMELITDGSETQSQQSLAPSAQVQAQYGAEFSTDNNFAQSITERARGSIITPNLQSLTDGARTFPVDLPDLPTAIPLPPISLSQPPSIPTDIIPPINTSSIPLPDGVTQNPLGQFEYNAVLLPQSDVDDIAAIKNAIDNQSITTFKWTDLNTGEEFLDIYDGSAQDIISIQQIIP